MYDLEYTCEIKRFLAAWGLLSLVENMQEILLVVSFGHFILDTMNVPVVVELLIEEWLLKPAGVNGSQAAIYAVDAHFIRAQADNGSMPEVCFVYGLDLDSHESYP